MKAVIMCGGSGTRLWPISRKKNPKQFAKLFNGKSLFQLTIERNINLVNEFIIVVNEQQLPRCQEQIPPIIKDKVNFIIEPIGRNTAPAITLAALFAPDSDLLILASDHLIKNQVVYEECVRSAHRLSKSGNLVTFGITAKKPETGYGYIEADGNNVISFKEKPDLNTAVSYISSGNYYWNSGMFLFNSKTYLEELKIYAAETLRTSVMAFENAKKDKNIYYIRQEDMRLIPENSIDYAVMEKSSHIKVIPSPFDWSDLGSFESLYHELTRDKNGNTQTENYYSIDSRNNLIIGQEKKVICTFDISDLIIVDTIDALLIGKKESSQKVKNILKLVNKNIDGLD